MRFIKLGVLIFSALVAASAAAGEVKVEYKDYKKFSDMKPANEPRGSYEKVETLKVFRCRCTFQRSWMQKAGTENIFVGIPENSHHL